MTDTVSIVGAGLMGRGIALQFALHGFEVRLNDVSREALDAAMDKICKDLNLLGDLDIASHADITEVPHRISTDTSLEHSVVGADLVIEAVYEDLELKRRVFKELDRLTPDHAILASNTSSFMCSQIATDVSSPDRALVANWWNPPYLLPLVEVVPGPDTSDKMTKVLCDLLAKAGKSPVVLSKESLGFVGNRLQFALLREAISIVENGVATAEDVDRVVTSSFGRRLAVAGPFKVFDIAGWDTILHIIKELFPAIESSPDVSTTVSKMVEGGDLGVKSGTGFYTWDDQSADNVTNRIGKALAVLQSMSEDDK